MQMQIEPTHILASPLLSFGVSHEEVDRVMLLLDGVGKDNTLPERVEHFLVLLRVCGSIQNAKLAYSLAVRSGLSLQKESCALLAESLSCSSCVPAAVKLWKTALEVGMDDPLALVTAAHLGGDGAGQIRVLSLLKQRPEHLPLLAETVRRLEAPGWKAEGSWGVRLEPSRGLVWWDNASPQDRQAFGMTLSTTRVCLRELLDVTFQFEARHEILGTTDRCHLEVSRDGRQWEKILKFEGTMSWQSYSLDLSAYHGEDVWLRFHVLSGGNRKGRGMEICQPRLEAFGVGRKQRFSFPESSEGWEIPVSPTPDQVLFGYESERPLISSPVPCDADSRLRVFFEAKMTASSVYADAVVEVLGADGELALSEKVPGGGAWSKHFLIVPESVGDHFSLRLCPKFSKRRPQDGLEIRHLSLMTVEAENWQECFLDGSCEDGIEEKKTLLELLESADTKTLRQIASLRRGLPSLKSTLSLSSFLESEDQVPALLMLSSRLKTDAPRAFLLLKEHVRDEDFLLQASVLLCSGMENYLSTRDYLGAGLLELQEFEDNSALYLSLREDWSEEEARAGLSLLLTPVANEGVEERRTVFLELFETRPTASEFILSWEKKWAEEKE